MDDPRASPRLFINKSFQRQNIDGFADRSLRHAEFLGPLALHDAHASGQCALYDLWPKVLIKILECNIKNYSIYLKDGILFGYFEYHGSDFNNDMEKMAAHVKTQEWWALMEPMQEPLSTRKPGEWWAEM